jgi:hypothetical protein
MIHIQKKKREKNEQLLGTKIGNIPTLVIIRGLLYLYITYTYIDNKRILLSIVVLFN